MTAHFFKRNTRAWRGRPYKIYHEGPVNPPLTSWFCYNVIHPSSVKKMQSQELGRKPDGGQSSLDASKMKPPCAGLIWHPSRAHCPGSHSQARPKLITWLGASAFLANRASAFLTREITHNALWNGREVGCSIKFFPLLLRLGEPQFCQCGMSDVACFLLALPPEGKQR